MCGADVRRADVSGRHRVSPCAGTASGPPAWELAADAFAAATFARASRATCWCSCPAASRSPKPSRRIRHCSEAKGYLLLPLHGELPPRDQDAAVARYDQPKVVVSTNVAETSLTIDGVRLVIDSGLARIPRYDANRGINTLLIEKISRASADQRAGRAGRTAPGRCVRLWSSDEHWQRLEHELPEIKRLDLAEVVLTLKAAGVEDLRRFRWLEAPAETSLVDAEALLTDLGALDHHGQITAIGRKMLAFPVHPRYARMLLAAQEYGCVHQAALVAALTQGRDLLMRKPEQGRREIARRFVRRTGSSDFWILMRAWNYAAQNDFRLDACRGPASTPSPPGRWARCISSSCASRARKDWTTEPEPAPEEALQKCILIGFSDRVARRLDAGTLRCELVHGRRGVLARESVVHHSPLLVAAEVREVEGAEKSVNTLLSLATAIEPDWLHELFPEDFTRGQAQVFYDAAAKRVCAEEQVRFRDLALSSKRLDPPPAEAAARLLAEEVIQGRLTLKQWDHSVDQWILRLNRLSQWCPELELPPIRRRRSPTSHRATLPRRRVIQGHQGPGRQTGGQVLALPGAAGAAGQARAGTADPGEWSESQGDLRARRQSVHRLADPGTL